MPSEERENRLASLENSRKLDRIIALIEGEPDAPGILARLALHDEVLFGRKGYGLVTKVGVMWRVHVWVMCSLSGIAGYLLRELFFKTKP